MNNINMHDVRINKDANYPVFVVNCLALLVLVSFSNK